MNLILNISGGVPHVFQSCSGILDEADAALDRAATFIGGRINTTNER